MRPPRLGRPDALALAVAAAALFGAGLVLYRQSAYGVMLSADSVHYVAMARNALAGHGFMSSYGNFPPEWPPLTSALYAAFSFGVFDPLDVVGPLNAAALALTVFTVGAWLRRRLESRLVVVWACLAAALEIAVVRMFDFAWSEPFFIPLCALALYWADRHLEDGKRSSLAWAAAFSALACMSKYSGPAVVAAIAGMLILRRGVSLKERFATAAAYSAAALAPMCAWMARNWLNTGLMTGERPITETALEHVAPMLEEMAKWWLPYVPIPGAESAAAWTAAALTTLTAALGMFTLARWLRTGADPFVPLAVGFAFAHAALALIGLRTGVIGMDRYVIPIYVPLLVAAAFALDRALAWARGVRVRRARAIPAAALIAALAAWTAYGGFVAASDAYETANGDGHGRMSRAFYESETIAFLRERRGANVGATFSNEPLQAYLASDGRGLFPRPDHSWVEMSAALEDRYGAADETIIVWFHDANLTPTSYGAAAFLFSPGFERLGAFQDGAVFRLKPGYAALDPREGTLIEDSYYDVYLNDGALTWVRQPCSNKDARGMVELWAQPVKPSDESAAVGMNFHFGDFGVKTGDLCAIRRALPDYPIKTVATGQFIPGGEWFYRTRIRMPLSDEALAYYRAKYESARRGELLAREDFDVYLDGGDLVYLKEPCAEEDTRGRFGLSAFPVDAVHFPEGEGRGHQSLNFDFENHGVIFEGRCMARITLPNYAIRAMNMSQWLADGIGLWSKAVQMPLADSDMAAYREKYAAMAARQPLARAGVFDLHVNGGELVYLKPRCSEDDARGHFHLRVYPVEIDALPQELRRDGHEFIRFEFVQHGIRIDGGCLIAAPLPDYMIRTIEASQNIPFEGDLWKTTIAPPLSAAALAYYRDEYAAMSAREPMARSDFAVYRDGGDLVYLKRPCGESDTAGRFSLTVFPARADDLPESRRETGHDSFGFAFAEYGAIFDDVCMMRYPLPEYPIRAIETGRWIRDEGFAWKTAAAIPLAEDEAPRYRDEYDAMAAREPLARSDFDVYMDGGDLVYLKRPCVVDDTRGRFSLSVFPADPDDLPPDRRAAEGHESLNFAFFRYGAVFGDRCMIRRALPDYPIRAIDAGQWIPGERGVWSAKIAIGE